MSKTAMIVVGAIAAVGAAGAAIVNPQAILDIVSVGLVAVVVLALFSVDT